MSYDLIVEARAFVPTGFQEVEIGIDQSTGKIAVVKRSLPGSPRVRYPGHLLIPSAVDLHVHFREPGHPAKEDFKTGTVGAAKGGVGTVVDMPNTVPVVDRPSRLEEKRSIVAPKAAVDWGLWSMLTRETRQAQDLLRESVGAKLFLAPTTGVASPPSESELARLLSMVRASGRPVVLHAERPLPKVARSLAQHDAIRPMLGEAEAIEQVARAGGADLRIHVAHASCLNAVEAAQKAGFSVGATPHHLLLAWDEKDLGTHGKANPPLRDHVARQALWNAFAAGRVPILESDHAPHTQDEKAQPFAEAPAGVPGVETLYPLLLRKAKENLVDADLVIRGYSQAPADFLGIPKGRIEAGYDADFFLINPRSVRRIRAADLQSKCGWSPFEGWEIHPVDAHYLRGQLIVEDQEFVGHVGRGRPVSATGPRVVRRS